MPRLRTKLQLAKAQRTPIQHYAISNFSAANFYQTTTGGEGGAATGFGFAALFRYRALPTASGVIRRRLTTPNGYQVTVEANLNLTALVGNGTSNDSVYAGQLASDVGGLHLVLVRTTGVPGNINLYLDRVLRNTVAHNAIAPTSLPSTIGAVSTGIAPFSAMDFLSGCDFRGIPTQAQIEALFDYVRVNGDLPPTFPASTVSTADSAITALTPRHWYRADTYTAGANLTALTNKGSAGGTMTAVGTIAVPTPHSKLKNNLAMVFDGVSTGYLDSSLPASEFKFLHAGTGCDVFSIIVPENNGGSYYSIWSTKGTNHEVGAWHYVRKSPSNIEYNIHDGSYYLFSPISAPIPVTMSTPMCVRASHKDLDPFEAINDYNGAVSVVTGSGTPSAADPAATLRIGRISGGWAGWNFGGAIAEILMFDRRLSPSEIQSVRNYVYTRYGIDAIAITHRWSARDALAVAGNPVIASGQTAPTSLADTVTASATDRMDRQGSPTIVTIDPNIDGRKSYGFLGASKTNQLRSDTGKGIAGSATTGLHVRMLWRPESLTTTRVLAGTRNTDAGWWIQISGSGVCGVIGNAATTVYTIQTAELNQWHLIEIVMTTDSKVRIYWDGVKIGADAATYFAGPYAGPMVWGWCNNTGTEAGDRESYMALAGGDYATTDAEALAAYQETMRTGRIATTAGKTQHLYDLTQDVIANGVDNGIPTQVLDRVGTDHLTRKGGLQINSAGGINGLTNWGPACVAATKIGGGVSGVGTGFFRAYDLILGVVNPTASVGIGGKANGGANGDYVRLISSGLQWYVVDSGGVERSAILPLVAGDATIRQRMVLQHDGSNITIYLGTSSNTISSACSGYLGHASLLTVIGDGLPNGLSANGLMTVYGSQIGQAILSAGEISALLADTTFAPIAGKTQHRVWIPDDIAEAGGKVPVSLKDRQASGDSLAITGAPVQVAQRKERLWSYETSPILYGANGFTTANHYSASAGAAGNSLAFGATLVWIPRSGASSAYRCLLSSLVASPSRGWDIRTTTTNANVNALAYNAANGVINSGQGSLTNLYDKICVFTMQWNGTTDLMRAYFNRVEIGSGTSTVGHAISTGAIRFGHELAGTTAPATFSDIFGFVLWDGIANLGQVQSQHDAILAADGRIQQMGGVTNKMLVDLTLDVQENNGVLPDLVKDRIGGNHFVKQGTPTLSSQYARAFGM